MITMSLALSGCGRTSALLDGSVQLEGSKPGLLKLPRARPAMSGADWKNPGPAMPIHTSTPQGLMYSGLVRPRNDGAGASSIGSANTDA